MAPYRSKEHTTMTTFPCECRVQTFSEQRAQDYLQSEAVQNRYLISIAKKSASHFQPAAWTMIELRSRWQKYSAWKYQVIVLLFASRWLNCERQPKSRYLVSLEDPLGYGIRISKTLVNIWVIFLDLHATTMKYWLKVNFPPLLYIKAKHWSFTKNWTGNL
jgi:hypothetical protein